MGAFAAPLAASAAGALFTGLSEKKKPKSFSPLSAEQQNALSALLPGLVQGGVSGAQSQAGINQGIEAALPQLLAGLTPGGQEEIFQQAVADPALRNFEQSVLPQIQQAAQNAGAGSSSAFQRALATAGTNLAADLASQRASFGLSQQQQALQNLLGIGGFNLQQQTAPASVALSGTQQSLVSPRAQQSALDVPAVLGLQLARGLTPGAVK